MKAALAPPTRWAAIAAVAALVVAAVMLFWPQADTKTISAHFERTVSLYEESEVRILGVPVGRVTAVVPEGTSVRVDMEYDAQYDVPANAQAVIISPTLVSDRFVQLTPAYTGGAVMADGADIPINRTASPVELDRIYQSLDELSIALGPTGANADGSLNRLLNVGAENFSGQGAKANQLIRDLAAASQTFSQGRGDLFATVRNLQLFTTELARHDKQVRSFMRNLAAGSRQLAGERDELSLAVRNLAIALGEVERFVKQNKGIVERDVSALAEVSGVLAANRETFETVFEEGTLGMSNLALAFDSKSSTIGSRIQVSPIIDDLDGLLCELVKSAETPHAGLACQLFEQLLEPKPGAAQSGVSVGRSGNLDELLGGSR